MTTELVSLASDGSQGNGFSGIPSLSENGHYVVFQSYTANLVSDVTSEVREIFIHDRTSHVTQRVSIASDGIQGNDDTYGIPVLSSDGRFVAFEVVIGRKDLNSTWHENLQFSFSPAINKSSGAVLARVE